MEIRPATLSDAEEGSLILRRSIEELYHQDHAGNPKVVANWVRNMTADTWCAWVDQEASAFYVAVETGRIIGVGMMNADGEIRLNYVSPDARLHGSASRFFVTWKRRHTALASPGAAWRAQGPP